MADSDRHGTGGESTRTSRRTLLRLAGAGGIAGIAGCASQIGGQEQTTTEGDDSGGDSDGGESTDESGGGGSDIGTVRYGILNPISGAYSSLGGGQRNGAELGVKHVNESDEFDFEIEATYEDTETNPEAATQAATRVIESDGADYLMGAISSSVAIALNSLALDNEVIYNPGGAAVPITGGECNEYVFRVETNTAQIAEAISAYTVEELGSNVWFHIADYAYGESVLNRTRSRMEGAEADFNEVGVTRSQLGASNYDSFISEIANSDADVALLGMTGGDLINFVRQAASQGLKRDVTLVSPTMSFQVVRGALGADAYGTYGGVRYVSTLETGDNGSFVEAYQSEYDGLPDNFARVGYESVRMTARGIQEAGTTDPTQVKDVLAGLEMPTIFGPNRFRECDQQAMNPTWMGELVEPEGGSGPAAVELVNELSGEEAALPCSETGCSL